MSRRQRIGSHGAALAVAATVAWAMAASCRTVSPAERPAEAASPSPLVSPAQRPAERIPAASPLAGLLFDPQGADFTSWINHFKNEVYRKWMMPPSVLMGVKGHVDFQFTVERDGTMSSVRMLKSSRTRALDKAAQNALQGSRFLPLPSDFGPPRVTMQVGFYYNEGPKDR